VTSFDHFTSVVRNEQETETGAGASLVSDDIAELPGAMRLKYLMTEASEAAEPSTGRAGSYEGGVTIPLTPAACGDLDGGAGLPEIGFAGWHERRHD